jgi:hypothetical protein
MKCLLDGYACGPVISPFWKANAGLVSKGLAQAVTVVDMRVDSQQSLVHNFRPGHSINDSAEIVST